MLLYEGKRRSFEVVASKGILTFGWHGQVSSCQRSVRMEFHTIFSVQLVEHVVGELKVGLPCSCTRYEDDENCGESRRKP